MKPIELKLFSYLFFVIFEKNLKDKITFFELYFFI